MMSRMVLGTSPGFTLVLLARTAGEQGRRAVEAVDRRKREKARE